MRRDDTMDARKLIFLALYVTLAIGRSHAANPTSTSSGENSNATPDSVESVVVADSAESQSSPMSIDSTNLTPEGEQSAISPSATEQLDPTRAAANSYTSVETEVVGDSSKSESELGRSSIDSTNQTPEDKNKCRDQIETLNKCFDCCEKYYSMNGEHHVSYCECVDHKYNSRPVSGQSPDRMTRPASWRSRDSMIRPVTDTVVVSNSAKTQLSSLSIDSTSQTPEGEQSAISRSATEQLISTPAAENSGTSVESEDKEKCKNSFKERAMCVDCCQKEYSMSAEHTLSSCVCIESETNKPTSFSPSRREQSTVGRSHGVQPISTPPAKNPEPVVRPYRFRFPNIPSLTMPDVYASDQSDSPCFKHRADGRKCEECCQKYGFNGISKLDGCLCAPTHIKSQAKSGQATLEELYGAMRDESDGKFESPKPTTYDRNNKPVSMQYKLSDPPKPRSVSYSARLS